MLVEKVYEVMGICILKYNSGFWRVEAKGLDYFYFKIIRFFCH
jgi:hypothetical protein